MGRPDWSATPIEADVRGREARRQRGDVGLINQRYGLVLFGNGQKLELHPWQAADEMTVRVPFAWDAEQVVPHEAARRQPADGTALVRGKVWPAADAGAGRVDDREDRQDPAHEGSPGIYADGISDVYFDNVKVYKNQ